MFVKFVRGFGPEFADQKEDPVSRAQKRLSLRVSSRVPSVSTLETVSERRENLRKESLALNKEEFLWGR